MFIKGSLAIAKTEVLVLHLLSVWCVHVYFVYTGCKILILNMMFIAVKYKGDKTPPFWWTSMLTFNFDRVYLELGNMSWLYNFRNLYILVTVQFLKQLIFTCVLKERYIEYLSSALWAFLSSDISDSCNFIYASSTICNLFMALIGRVFPVH